MIRFKGSSASILNDLAMEDGLDTNKLERLCQLLKPCFEAKVPFGDILSFRNLKWRDVYRRNRAF